ncbi:MAG: fructose-1,6-bisphosphatase [Christensenellales bacterium]
MIFSEEILSDNLEYLTLLSSRYPNIPSASTEIINLSAILSLPKGTEQFLSDLHGEHESFLHILRNASGVIHQKIDTLYENTVSLKERNALAMLIYYPEKKLALVRKNTADLNDWYKITLLRLIEVCKFVASKYTRYKVRKALPEKFAYIIDELINANDVNNNKVQYYNEIIHTIIETESADAFIISISYLIQRLAIDCLHIIGDIFDRGPGASRIVDALMDYHTVDVQWGNHDILYMGAAAGNEACIATTVTNCMRYANIDTLEDGYGISMRPLATFALETYGSDPCACFSVRQYEKNRIYDKHDMDILAKMHKAIAIIQFKLESQIIKRHPEYAMNYRLVLDDTDFKNYTVVINQKKYPLTDRYFPTVDPAFPDRLTPQESDVVDKLKAAFTHSSKLQEHAQFLLEKGSMYKLYNSNLLYHGCIPMDDDGSFTQVDLYGKMVSGKAYLERLEEYVRRGFSQRSSKKETGMDLMWYLWCGKDSPLYGKSNLTTYYRYFVEDESTWEELHNPYYQYTSGDDESYVLKILEEFALDPSQSHIVNGHVPVKVKKGETPVKANGKLLVIDGGLSKAYQSVTGIAGYTLISNSKGMYLAAHEPFESVQNAITQEEDMQSTPTMLERILIRKRVGDTDMGKTIQSRIEYLQMLLCAYKSGLLRETSKEPSNPLF